MIKKIRFGRNQDELEGTKNICHDPRRSLLRGMKEESFEKHTLASSTPNICFFAFLSMPETPSENNSSIVTEVVDSLDSPFQDSFVKLSVSGSDDSMVFSDDYYISCLHFKESFTECTESLHLILNLLLLILESQHQR